MISVFLDKIKDDTQFKRVILQALNEEISSLPTKIEKLKEESESLDVELVSFWF